MTRTLVVSLGPFDGEAIVRDAWLTRRDYWGLIAAWAVAIAVVPELFREEGAFSLARMGFNALLLAGVVSVMQMLERSLPPEIRSAAGAGMLMLVVSVTLLATVFSFWLPPAVIVGMAVFGMVWSWVRYDLLLRALAHRGDGD